jgi:predicted O-methyltransferase YrrM
VNQDMWSAVDEYVVEALGLAEPLFTDVQQACDEAGLPPIQVSAAQGKFLEILVRMTGTRRILELGTLGGYSAIWMARALPPGGIIVTVELDPKHAAVASSNFERAGVSDRVELRVGSALETLPLISESREGPFDLFFIDADKANIPAYFEWALRMSHAGSVIVVDNVVREGAVVDASSDDPSVKGVRRLNEMLAAESRVDSTVLQTVGVKGYDGFAITFVKR